ncbi:MAG: carbohydrate porin [Silvibacterium sp.]|nr:carbohydrate porin [Silvibacterium sp.]
MPDAPGPGKPSLRDSARAAHYADFASGPSNEPAKPQDQPVGQDQESEPAPSSSEAVTVFPHPDNTRYYLGGQANSIGQVNASFHSPYEGPNSFLPGVHPKASYLGTFYSAIQPHRNIRYNTDLIVDAESTGGRGLSQALGLAGFTNLDVVRNPNLSSAPYLARGEIHQTFGLTNQMVDAERTPISLATKVPLRRFEFRIGKMTMPDLFDLNPVGSDSHLQFTNWTVDNQGAWDYAADTRGYTIAAVLEYDDRNWSARYGFAAMPILPNGIELDWAFSRARGQNMEFELDKSLIPGRHGETRILSYVNKAHMGIYKDAINNYLTGVTPTPEIDYNKPFGTIKYGFDWNNWQELTSDLRIFSRFGWNEGAHESYAYTEVDQSVSFGGDYNLSRWHQPNDKVGVAFVSNAIKKYHQLYLAYGGLGFILGDGHLNYGRENIVETYFTHHVGSGLFISAGLSHVANPGYNRDRGPVWVPMLRAHVDF